MGPQGVERTRSTHSEEEIAFFVLGLEHTEGVSPKQEACVWGKAGCLAGDAMGHCGRRMRCARSRWWRPCQGRLSVSHFAIACCCSKEMF